MTAQQVFDKVYVHLLTQNAKSESDVGCAYRGDNGMKCAAGCLIPNAMYRKSMEGKSWNSVYPMFVEVAQKCGLNDHWELISLLQKVHDNRPPSEWQKCLKNFAKELNLTVPEMPR